MTNVQGYYCCATLNVKENGVITTFEKRELIPKCYWKMKNVTEVLRRWRNEFGAGGGHFEHCDFK
jgi:hypothetical protein